MDDSPLAVLSAELRNNIYEFVFADQKPVDIIPATFDQSTRQHFSFEQNPSTSRTLPVALTQTCRAIRQESSQMLYASLCFSFRTTIGLERGDIWPNDTAQAFIDRLCPGQAAVIHKLILGSAPCLTMHMDKHLYSLDQAMSEALLARLDLGLAYADRLQKWLLLAKIVYEILFDGSLDPPDFILCFWLKGKEVLWEQSFQGAEEAIISAERDGQAERLLWDDWRYLWPGGSRRTGERD